VRAHVLGGAVVGARSVGVGAGGVGVVGIDRVGDRNRKVGEGTRKNILQYKNNIKEHNTTTP
jgi:hypothetical protein